MNCALVSCLVISFPLATSIKRTAYISLHQSCSKVQSLVTVSILIFPDIVQESETFIMPSDHEFYAGNEVMTGNWSGPPRFHEQSSEEEDDDFISFSSSGKYPEKSGFGNENTGNIGPKYP